jgi:hypothetical protein
MPGESTCRSVARVGGMDFPKPFPQRAASRRLPRNLFSRFSSHRALVGVVCQSVWEANLGSIWEATDRY